MAPVRRVVVGLVVVAMTASVGCRSGDDPLAETAVTTVGQVTIGETASTSTTEAAFEMGTGGGPPQHREIGQAVVLGDWTLHLDEIEADPPLDDLSLPPVPGTRYLAVRGRVSYAGSDVQHVDPFGRPTLGLRPESTSQGPSASVRVRQRGHLHGFESRNPGAARVGPMVPGVWRDL